ncbi:MAG: hypothetical protein JWO31_3001, partial [Phycisphaerales bacterium]|nr:hypothetical protein [Phycisphaerales bacterium]
AGPPPGPIARSVLAAARVATLAFLLSLVAAALGYVALATLLANAVLGGAYVAVILYAATRVADGLWTAALRVRPLALLRMVREHRTLFWRRGHRLIHWAAVAAWVLVALDLLNVRTAVFDWARWALTTPLVVGSFSLALQQVLEFGLVVWAAVLVSRFAQFALEEDVYPRAHLPRGMPYAVNTVLNYAVLGVGFTIGIGALGLDLTKFTILAGAFGVGLGFGLQNIFNNFVSGLILLFERPVKVGDVVQIGDQTGTVRRIGIRASFVRTGGGADIIVPNGRLIADPVTNWTLSGRGRAVELAIGVAGGTEPRQVMLLWKRACADHPKVAEEPPPKALVVAVAADAVRFELRAWTNDFDAWPDTRSDLLVAVNAALAAAGIGVR